MRRFLGEENQRKKKAQLGFGRILLDVNEETEVFRRKLRPTAWESMEEFAVCVKGSQKAPCWAERRLCRTRWNTVPGDYADRSDRR